MRYCAFLITLLILLGTGKVAAKEVWLGTSITNERVNFVTSYDGILLVGTEKGAYTGIKMFLDGVESGYPDYDWGLTPLRSIYTSAEHEQFLKETSSMAVLEDGTVYALSDSGLYYIPTTFWSIGIPEQQVWKRDTTFTTEMTKLSGHGAAIFITVAGKLYRKTKESDWTHIPFYTDWDMVNDEKVRGPEQIITDYKVCGQDIVVTIESQYDSPGKWSDIYVTCDTGKSWFAGPVHLLNLVDFTTYRTFWNDLFPDIAYCQNEPNNDSTKVTFHENFGGIFIDTLIESKQVVKYVKGVSQSIGVSAVSKSDIPYFYLSLSSGVYQCGADYELVKDDIAPENMRAVYVSSDDVSELLAYSENALFYKTYMHGTALISTEQKSAMQTNYSVVGNSLSIKNSIAGSYALYSLQGRVLRQGELERAMSTISLTSLAKGTYLLRLDIGGALYTKMISVK